MKLLQKKNFETSFKKHQGRGQIQVGGVRAETVNSSKNHYYENIVDTTHPEKNGRREG